METERTDHLTANDEADTKSFRFFCSTHHASHRACELNSSCGRLLRHKATDSQQR